jgi:hypothetical protein
MKRTATSKPSTARRNAGIVSAGILLAAQAVAQAPTKASPAARSSSVDQKVASSPHIKFVAALKLKGELTCPGTLQGAPVFKNTKGEYFTVDCNTGDLRFHTAESLGYIKIGDASSRTKGSNLFIKFDGIKGEQRVTLAGVDAQGRVLQQNSRGEVFSLSPNGDMMFVK